MILPSYLHDHQDPHPGPYVDQWNYETMKTYAFLFRSYYPRGQDGLLYRNGTLQPGLGLTANKVFEYKFVGDHHGLVFVDTLDQLPPRSDNLGMISLTTEYAEGLFMVNAHVDFKPTGVGKPVSALSPPDEGSNSLGSRVPVELSNVHLQGVLYTAGNVLIEGQPRFYEALATGGTVRTREEEVVTSPKDHSWKFGITTNSKMGYFEELLLFLLPLVLASEVLKCIAKICLFERNSPSSQ